MATAGFDPERLRSAAERLRRGASLAPLLYAVVGLVVGAVLGTSLVVGTNVIRRVRQLRNREDASELVHEVKGDGDDADDAGVKEVSLRERVPSGALGAGVLLAALGAILGVRRGARMRFDADHALCLLEIEKNTRPPPGGAISRSP
jgi:hypothetical protein